MGSINQLPKISEAFRAHVADHAVQKREWVPCPRCGAPNVQPAAGAAIGAVAGVSMAGCSAILMFGFIVISFLVFPPLGILLLIGTVIMFFIMPAVGAL